MRILWLCNIMLPIVSNSLNRQADSFGGWLTGLSNDLLKISDVQLSVCFPVSSEDGLLSGEVENMKYFGFPQKKLDKHYAKTEEYFAYIIQKVNPDVIHIFGTEFPHTLAMVNTCERLDVVHKVLISIQGLVSVYPIHYYASLPMRIIRGYSFRDFIRRQNMERACKKCSKKVIWRLKHLRK